ncbi:hypothetical protein EJB05_00443, partial [Eragrostis curvula]
MSLHVGWWLDGMCADTGGSQCFDNATCHDMATPRGHRRVCKDGVPGPGDGRRRMLPRLPLASSPKHDKLPALIPGVTAASVVFLLTMGLSAWFLVRRRKQQNFMVIATKTVKKTRGREAHYSSAVNPWTTTSGRARPGLGNSGPPPNRRLGRGGFGSLYNGFLTDTIRHVALKCVSETLRHGWKDFFFFDGQRGKSVPT